MRAQRGSRGIAPLDLNLLALGWRCVAPLQTARFTPVKGPPESLNGRLREPQSRSRLLGEKKFTKELSAGGGGGRYSVLLRAGLSGDQTLVGARFCTPVQTGPGVQRAPYTMGNGFLSRT